MRVTSIEVIEPPFKYKNPTGLSDILPDSQRYWHYSENLMHQISSSFGYHRVITPPVEARSLYEKAFGDSASAYLIDSNIDDGGEHYVFSAHPRVSLIRSFQENGFANWPPPVHLAYRTNTMRRTLTGYEQKHLYCFDVIGAKDVTTSATMLVLLRKLAQELKLKSTNLSMHSSGCAECRPAYDVRADKFCAQHSNSLCPACKENPSLTLIMNCEEDSAHNWLHEAPALLDHLCPACHAQLTSVLEACDQLGINYDINSLLFPDTAEAEKTTFSLQIGNEVIPAVIGYHYDRLASSLAETPLSAIGVTIDLKRFSQYLEAQHTSLPNAEGIQVFIAQLGQQARTRCLPLLHELYNAGYSAATASESESITHQLQVAERLRARITLIVGQKEAINGHVIMRDMVSGLQDNVYMEELIPVLEERLHLA